MSRKKAVVRKPKIKKKTDYYDYSLLAVIILLTCFGLVMLYSTSSYMAELNYGDDMYYFKKQAAISLACIIAALAISKIDYHILTRFTGVIYGVAAVLMLLVMLSFGSMALPLAVTLVPQGLDWLYFVLMELSALTVSVLASAFTSYGHLFRCRDNQQLLALPIPPGAIFAVRCGGVYLTGLIYLLLAWVPSVVCYALAAPRPGEALLAALPVALALAGVSMVLAVLLGWAVALLNRRARHKSLVTVVGTLLFLAVYYAAFCWVSNAVDALALDAVQAGATAGRAAAPLRLLGLAAVGNVPALLLFLALAAACMVFCGKVLAKPYLRLLTLEPGRAKAEYRAKTQKKQPPRRALLRRELLHLGACPMWLLNCALSSLLLPVLGVAVLWKAAALRAFTAAYPPESLPMLVCGMVCAIAAMNFITAPSVSLEGGTLWLLQSLPVAPQQVLRVKVELQLLLTLPGAWFCAGCAMAVLCIPAGQGLLVLAVLAAFVWLTAQLGLALGLCLPNLHWVSEAAVVKRSAASMLAMFGGWLLAGGVLFLPLTLLDYAVPPLAAQTVCLAVLLGLDLLLHRGLCTRGAARFAALH